jgi:quercetin dioxygenase-like cupin family protein
MRVARAGRTGTSSEQRGPTFTGRVWADPVLAAADGIMVNNVFFEPGARTHWHTHEVAQVLQVVAGEGRLQSRDGTGVVLRAGDTAHIPAGEEHWHGAAPGSYLLHLAVSVGATSWLEAVTDADYAAALERPPGAAH